MEKVRLIRFGQIEESSQNENVSHLSNMNM